MAETLKFSQSVDCMKNNESADSGHYYKDVKNELKLNNQPQYGSIQGDVPLELVSAAAICVILG
jgi:hypothetical protein